MVDQIPVRRKLEASISKHNAQIRATVAVSLYYTRIPEHMPSRLRSKVLHVEKAAEMPYSLFREFAALFVKDKPNRSGRR